MMGLHILRKLRDSSREVWRHVRLYRWYLRSNWLSLMAYPVPFAMQNLFGIAYSLGSAASVWVLFSKIRALGGWTLPQIMLIYGLSIFSRSLFHLFWVGLMTLPGTIRSGEIDRTLVRPLHPLFQVLAGELDSDDYGELAVALYLIWTALGSLGQRTFANCLWILVAGLSGMLIFASLHLLANATAFFTVEARGASLLAWQLDEFTRYPADMYDRAVKNLITWVIPVAFASFYPAQVIFENARLAALARLTPVVAMACFSGAKAFWDYALDHYQGVGH